MIVLVSLKGLERDIINSHFEEWNSNTFRFYKEPSRKIMDVIGDKEMIMYVL